MRPATHTHISLVCNPAHTKATLPVEFSEVLFLPAAGGAGETPQHQCLTDDGGHIPRVHRDGDAMDYPGGCGSLHGN